MSDINAKISELEKEIATLPIGYISKKLFRTKDQKISIVGKSKLLDFPTMPTTAESLPLLISFCIH